MRSLIDFFNHGILPFVGRAGELERLERFWRDSVDAHGLRAALVLGEAGAGKSRMVEELLPRVTSAGGLVVHTKFYPGTSTSIASLLAAALGASTTARGLLKREPEETLGAAIVALQRLARLRPLLIVIEDIHLLEGDARAEFVSFLEGIADETIALVCLARPADMAARGILERYLVEEHSVAGIDRDDVRALWRTLFGADPDDAVLDALYETTAGTPLALRTALRAALKSEAIVGDAGRWRVATSIGEFRAVLERNVTLLAEGMAAHLTIDERRSAVQLAALGEIFTREAAAIVLDDVGRALDVLTFKGILAPPSVTGAPLPPGRSSAQLPSAFVHTLLHRHLADQVDPDPARLVALLASEAPLYSALPFQLVVDATSGTRALQGVDRALVRAAIERSLAVAAALDRTAEWPLGMTVLGAAEALVAARSADWSDEELRELSILLLRHRLELLRRESTVESYGVLIERLVELTAEPLPEHLLGNRLAAMRFEFLFRRRRDIDACRRIQAEAEQLLALHPRLRFCDEYLDLLEATARSSGGDDDRDIYCAAEERMNAILASTEATEEYRARVFRRVAPHFLWRFSNAAELAERRRMLERLEAVAEPNEMSLPPTKAAFLQGTGHVDEALAVLDQLQPWLREHGHLRQYHSTQLLRLYALGWRTERLADLESLAERMIADAPPVMAAWMRQRSGVHLVRIGLLHGDPGGARAILDRFIGPERAERELPPELHLLLAAAEGRITEALEMIRRENLADSQIRPLVAASLGEPVADRAALLESITDLLELPVLTRDNIVLTLNTIAMVEHLEALPGLAGTIDDVRPGIRAACARIMAWLQTRGLGASMRSFLRVATAHIDAAERAAYLERIDEMERRQASETRTSEPRRMRVSMLGSIEIHHAGEQPTRVRGARLRTLLGLMTADRMLERPLSLREFQRIASGGEDDPERARKTTSMGVLRLRETIGSETILTDGETPRLNPLAVSVDLLEAHGRLDAVGAALEDRSWVQAHRALLSALEITRGRVPFPGLYEEFFEAARDDFEYTLRTAIIAVGRGMIDEGDPAGAVEILTRGFDAMPEDEEIVELLRGALVAVGRRTEAERVRLRAEST